MPSPDELMNQFKTLEKKVEANKLEKVKLEERLKTLQEEETKLLNELAKNNLKPEELEVKIKNLQDEIINELNECQRVLNS